MIWTSTGLFLAAPPHALHVPIWVSIVFGVLVVVRLTTTDNPHSKSLKTHIITSRIFRIMLAMIILIGIFVNFGTFVGRDAGVALLILLAGMKLTEIKNKRDYYISAYIAFLLILTNLFYSQSVLTTLYMTISILVIIGSMICFNDNDASMRIQGWLRTAGKLFLQAFPLMLIAFLLFPRVSGPLWGLPKDAQTGITGIDDEMSPGSISQLILSDEVAFRVEFEGTIPDKSKLYWRGPVLWYTDGFKWVPDKPKKKTALVLPYGNPVKYTVTLEPTDKNWLYGRALPDRPAENSFFSHDLQIKRRRPVTIRSRYQLTSYTDYRLVSDNADEFEDTLQLPNKYHSQAIALARSWRDAMLEDREIVQKALQYFNEQEFYYTLTPPLLINDTVDEFLFETRQGFCEHYASAFVILMRAAGIPARIVTGYQGGYTNPIGNYLIVYQRYAHAWTEVWLGDNLGWTRIDPTSAVSPERVTDGIESALPNSIINIPMGLYRNSIARGIWRRLNNTIDAINNNWNQWVLGYDRRRQSRLLNRFGVDDLDYRELMTSLIIIVFIFLGIIAFSIFKQDKENIDKAKGWYNKFLKRLSKCGIRNHKHEGPVDFSRRAIRLRTDPADAIRNITETYVQIRYAGHREKFEELELQGKQFKPSTRNTA